IFDNLDDLLSDVFILECVSEAASELAPADDVAENGGFAFEFCISGILKIVRPILRRLILCSSSPIEAAPDPVSVDSCSESFTNDPNVDKRWQICARLISFSVLIRLVTASICKYTTTGQSTNDI